MARIPRKKVVAANAFSLVDAEGVERASWTVGSGGTPAFSLKDAAGRTRLSSQVLEDGSPHVVLADSAGEERLIMTVGNDEPRIWLYDGVSHEPRIGLMVDSKQNASVEVYAARSEAAIATSMDKDGKGSLAFFGNRSEKPLISLTISVDEQGAITLRTTDGVIRWDVSSETD